MAFDANFLRTLEALHLRARQILAGDERSERRTAHRGASMEFADYRPYTPGDDVRYIDWNVYARHGSLFVKEFAAEENIHLSILLDSSRSMEFAGKFDAARELAAALGYIGLAHYDSVSLWTFGRETRAIQKFLRGKAQVFPLLESLEGLSCEGETNLQEAFRAALPRLRGRSLVLVLSDFYDPAGYSAAVRSLQEQQFQVQLIHVIAREELAPPVRGRVRLTDLETGRQRLVTIRPGTAEAYLRRFLRFCDDLKDFARAHEAAYARVRADDPLDRRVLEVLRAGGILEYR